MSSELRRVAVAWIAAVLIATMASAQAPDAGRPDGMPEATCIVLAETADSGSLPDLTYQGSKEPLVIDATIRCRHVDDAATATHVERLEITYSVIEPLGVAPPRGLRRSLEGPCSEAPLDLPVTLLTAAQKRRPPFRNADGPVKVEARLSVRARQANGPKHPCFGTLRYVFQVAPGEDPADR